MPRIHGSLVLDDGEQLIYMGAKLWLPAIRCRFLRHELAQVEVIGGERDEVIQLRGR